MPLFIAAGMLLGASTVSAVASEFPSISWPATWHLFCGLGCGLLFFQMASSSGGRRCLAMILTTTAFFVVGTYLYAVAGLWRDWLSFGLPIGSLPLRPANAGGLVPIPTWLGDVTFLVVPSGAYALSQRGVIGRAAAIALIGAALAALFISGTRSLWLIALASALPAALVFGNRRVVMAGAIGLAVIAVAFASQASFFTATLRSIDEGRSSAFSSAITQFQASPLFGVGPGLYPLRRLAEPIEPIVYLAFPNAHNLVLTTAAEVGATGLVCLVLATAIILRWSVGAPLNIGTTRQRVIAAFSVGAVLAHAMIDVVIEVPGILILATAVGALALAPGPESVDEGRMEPRPRFAVLPVSLAVVGLIAGAYTVRTEAAIMDLRRANEATTAPDMRVVLAADAAGLSPDMIPAWNALAVAEAGVGDTASALTAAEHVVALDPLPQQEMTLALYEAATGRTTEATARMRRVAELGHLDSMVQLNAAVFFAEHGQRGEATSALTRVLVMTPSIGLVLGDLPRAARELLPTARLRAVDELLAAGNDASALAVAVLLGDQPLITAVLDHAANAGDDTAPVIVDAWAGHQGAISELDRRARANPADADLAWWRWLVAGHSCDIESRNRWSRIIRIKTGFIPQVPVRLGRVPSVRGVHWPTLYPDAVWRFSLPAQPYPPGTWTFRAGEPTCPR
jgi:O-antigen ligase